MQVHKFFSIYSPDLALSLWVIAPNLRAAIDHATFWHVYSCSKNPYEVIEVKDLDPNSSTYYEMEHFGDQESFNELVNLLVVQANPDEEVRIKSFGPGYMLSAPLYAWLSLSPRIIGELNASK